MKVGKLIFGGAMASILMVGAASAAVGDTSLTTKKYVDAGLRAVYSAAGTAADSKISTAIGTLGDKTEGTPYSSVKDYVDTQVNLVSGGATGAINGLQSSIGTLTDLETDAKGNLVAAINEVNTHADTNKSAIDKLNGTGDGSVQKTVTDAIATAIATNGVINTAVTTGVTNMVNATTLRMRDQLGWDMSKSPDEDGSFAKTVKTQSKTVVGAINELNTKVDAIDIQSGAAGYITVIEDEENPGKFTVGLANDVATEFPGDFNFSQN